MNKKKRCFRLLLLSVFFIFNVISAWSQSNHYIRSGSSGNGSDWNNSTGSLPSTLIRGDTYYIADGNYSSYTFDDPGSEYIYIKKATIDNHGTDMGWDDGYGDNVATFSGGGILWYFRTGSYGMDGQVGGGPGNWDTGHGFRLIVSDSGYGIRVGETVVNPPRNQPSNFVFKHIDLGGESNTNKGYRLFYNWAGSKTLGSNNLSFSDCYFHDMLRSGLFLMYARNVIIERTMFARNTSTSTTHGALFADRGTDNMVFRYCFFLDGTGTAYIDVKKNEDQTHQNWKIYGNVFALSPGNPYGCFLGGNGAIGMTSTSIGWSRDFEIYNNSFINCKGLNIGIYFPLGSNIKVYNNIWYNCDKINHVGDLDIRNNHYLDTSFSFSTEIGSGAVIGSGDPFVDWVNRNFYLKNEIGDSIILGSEFNTDMFNVTRGSDGVWDRGAIEYGGVLDTEAPTIPTNLSTGVLFDTSIEISWSSSIDNVAVAGYKIFRDGVEVGISQNTSFADNGLIPSTTYVYQVLAYDASNNESALSLPVEATTDDYIPPQVTVNISDDSKTEGDTGTVSSFYNVTLSIAAEVPVTMNYATVAVTATELIDYEGKTGSLTFNPGETQKTITVLIIGDTDIEEDETFNVVLSEIQGAVFGNKQATGTIIDDDAPQDLNLTAHWKFDEGSGTTANDSSGNNRHASVRGATWVPGKFGGALRFNGVDNDVVTGDSQFDIVEEMTISLWIYPEGGILDQTLVGRGTYVHPYRIVLEQDSGRIRTIIRTVNGTDYLNSSPVILGNTWQHVALTYRSGERVIYINGEMNVSNSPAGDLRTYVEPGYLAAIDNAEYYQGIMDDVRFYNRALTAAEIKNIYSGTPWEPEPDIDPPEIPVDFAGISVSRNEINDVWN